MDDPSDGHQARPIILDPGSHSTIRGNDYGQKGRIKRTVSLSEFQDESILRAAGKSFDPIWEALTGRKKCRLLQLLIQRISFDVEKGMLSICYRPSGIRGLIGARA